jgi:hypothetical protein
VGFRPLFGEWVVLVIVGALWMELVVSDLPIERGLKKLIRL